MWPSIARHSREVSDPAGPSERAERPDRLQGSEGGQHLATEQFDVAQVVHVRQVDDQVHDALVALCPRDLNHVVRSLAAWPDVDLEQRRRRDLGEVTSQVVALAAQ